MTSFSRSLQTFLRIILDSTILDKVTVEPAFVKRYMKALANKGLLPKETGHPLRYSSYQNWCPVMVAEAGFEPTTFGL